MAIKVIKESNDFERYTYVRSKEVPDSDGFNTEYTMYYDEVEDRYVFVFGDSDLYNPNDGSEEFDYECDTEREANEWFDNYDGFEDLDENYYRVWYHPYGLPDEEDAIEVSAADEKEARFKASDLGYTTSVEEITEDEYRIYSESKKPMKESKRVLDLPKDIAEFVFSRQPDFDGDDYQFENAIEACEKYTELSDEAYEDQNVLEQELRDIDDKQIKMLAAQLGVYEMVDDNDLAMMADQLKSSDDLILVMSMNGFKNIERRGNKIYYTRGRNGEEEYIDAPEWR